MVFDCPILNVDIDFAHAQHIPQLMPKTHLTCLYFSTLIEPYQESFNFFFRQYHFVEVNMVLSKIF